MWCEDFFSLFLTDKDSDGIFETKSTEEGDSNLPLYLKYSILDNSCQDDGIVQWSNKETFNQQKKCNEKRNGHRIDVLCDFEAIDIAAQTNHIQFCWVAGFNNGVEEHWILDDVTVDTQPCVFPKRAISSVTMSPKAGPAFGNTKVTLKGGFPIVDSVSYEDNAVYCLFGEKRAKRVEVIKSNDESISEINCGSRRYSLHVTKSIFGFKVSKEKGILFKTGHM